VEKLLEFGARLSLKDNMSATLLKNLKTQKKFSDQVNKTSNNVNKLNKAKANPKIGVNDKATSAIAKIKDGLKAVGNTSVKAMVGIKDTASAGLSAIKSTLGTLAKGVTVAVGVAGAGLGALVGGSLKEGASLQQSTGGIETLFKDNAGIVKANADMAFKSAGLSANAYMEQVTSFSASLLNSLGGDTAKSAQVADRAIIDMADNANKMGTSMDLIQNAYQGFAKQNYTMLDNLKLGYGGTQEEMKRLIADASKMTKVQKDLGVTVDGSSMSFDNVINAISVMQGHLGIAGATAEEADGTFSGSFASMKASAQNLLGALSTGGNIEKAMTDLVNTATTFLINNALPMIANVFVSLPTAIRTAISKVAPKLKESGGEIVKGIKTGIITMLPASMQGVANDMAGALEGAFGNGGGIIQKFKDIVAMAMPTVKNLLGGVVDVVKSLAPVMSSLGNMFMDIFPSILGVVDAVIPAIVPLMKSLGSVIQVLIPVVTQIIQTFAGIIQQVFPVVANVFTMVINAVMPIVQALANVIQQALPIVASIITIVTSTIESIFPTVSRIFTEVGLKVAEVVNTVVVPVMNTLQKIIPKLAPVVANVMKVVVDALSGAWDIISPILDLFMATFEVLWAVIDPILVALVDGFTWLWDKLQPIFDGFSKGVGMVGDAVGGIADFAIEGADKVKGFLGFAYGKDRVPYDNYPAMLHQGERVLTRNQADQYDRAMSTRGVQVSGAPVSLAQGTSSASTGGNTVNIEKLADTVIIEKEADVDKVVEDMITKFKKLVPNMA
jgi:phage-related protein